jgi:hypothetical protein
LPYVEQLTDVLEVNYEDGGGTTDHQTSSRQLIPYSGSPSIDNSVIKSLNLKSRLKELERIDRENLKMINVLIRTRPGVQSAR